MQPPGHKIPVLGNRPWIPVYLLKDQFTSADPAPLVTPRACEPGPGTLTATETDGSFSISGGALNFAAQTTPNWGDLALVDATGTTRTAGRALYFKVYLNNVVGQVMIGWCTATVGNHTIFDAAVRFNLTNIQNVLSGVFSSIDACAATTAYQVCLIVKSIGFLLFIKGGTFTEWTLLWVSSLNSTAALYPRILNYDSAGTIDDFYVTTLASPFNTDMGYATYQLAGARSAGDTFIHAADFWGEFTVTTVPAAGVIDYRFRQQDATNYWQVTIDSTGALVLNEVVGGGATARGTSAGVIANGDRVVVIASGQTIRVFEGPASTGATTVRITYAAAANFVTSISGVLSGLGTGGAVSGIITYPRTASGAAKTVLDKINP